MPNLRAVTLYLVIVIKLCTISKFLLTLFILEETELCTLIKVEDVKTEVDPLDFIDTYLDNSTYQDDKNSLEPDNKIGILRIDILVSKL